MFNEFHKFDGIQLAFVKSNLVKAFPCGRRRSEKIDADGDTKTTSDIYHFPFDPEARLNTELNNRKHAGSNGFTQTYLLDWTDEYLKFYIAGYAFELKTNLSITDFCKKVILDNTNSSKIYANIRIEEVPLYQATELSYKTWILRDQTAYSNEPVTTLDLLCAGQDRKLIDSYYFSGLSFSTEPITKDTTNSTQSSNKTAKQQVFSLCIAEKTGDSWQIHQPALLPKIEHGKEPDSVKVNIIDAEKIRQNDKLTAIIDLAQIDKNTFQLQLSNVNKS